MDLVSTIKKTKMKAFKFPANGNVTQAFNRFVNSFPDEQVFENMKSKTASERLIINVTYNLIDFYFRITGKTLKSVEDFKEAHNKIKKAMSKVKFMNGEDFIKNFDYYTFTASFSGMRAETVSKQLGLGNIAYNLKELKNNEKITKNIFVIFDLDTFDELFDISKNKSFNGNLSAICIPNKEANGYDNEVTHIVFCLFPTGSLFKRMTTYISSKEGSSFNKTHIAMEMLTPFVMNDWGIEPHYISIPFLNYAVSSIFIKRSQTYAKMELFNKFTFCYNGIKKALLQFATAVEAIKNEQAELKRMKSDYATAFVPLKNNTKKALEIAKTSSFNKFFSEVELDGTGDANHKLKTDYQKFEQINQAFPHVYSMLPKMQGAKPALRFRKLGHHHATGLYFPFVNCIDVDIRDVGSFVHEYGHYLDYQNYKHISLNNPDFIEFVGEYKQSLVKKVSANKIKYFSLPSEVFARSFEVWCSQYKEMSKDEQFNLFCNQKCFQQPEYQFLINNEKMFKLMDSIILK